MRVKSLLAVIVLNIFLMLFTTLLLEYLSLDERFNQLQKNIQVCTDMTVDISTASEEMFTEKYANDILSEAIRHNEHSTKVAAKTLLGMYKSGTSDEFRIYGVNSYMLAKYYAQEGHLPKSKSDFDSKVNLWGTDQLKVAYEFIYGKAGSDYSHHDLEWANINESKEGSGGSRTPTANFNAFYQGIGKKVMSAGYVKRKDGDGFKVETMKYPTLVSMGLLVDPLNEVDSSTTADTFTSSEHIGKAFGSKRNSKYYLTPASLGVTYIPTEVFKPVFMANLDTMIRLQKASGGGISGASVTDAQATVESASGCVDTDVYVYGANGNGDIQYGILNTVNGSDNHSKHIRGSDNHINHKSGADELIVNDGTTEYDLNSLKVKVDYLLVDFAQPSSARLASRLNGLLGLPSGTSGMTNEEYTRQQFISEFADTGMYAGLGSDYDDIRTKRLVARVSVKMKVHVLYQSSLLQWMCYRTNTSPHMDMKMYNPVSGDIYSDSNGVWYQYTTYYCQSR